MSSPKPRHVFVSYSRANNDFADKLTRDLKARGIAVWIDHDGLHPGMPNWENAIRVAIDKAFAIVFVASPDAAQSSPVQGELSIARDAGKTILPVWAAGDRWSSCAPLEMSRAQYTDLRDEQYDAHIPDLIAAIEQQRPAHLILDEDDPPRGYFKVALGFGEPDSAAFKYSAFAKMRDFTDVLYTNYLRDTLAPFTYGSEWVLASDAGVEQKRLKMRRLCLPFTWFLLMEAQRKQPLITIDAHWADGPLASFGVHSETRWQVMKVPQTIFAVATNESFFGKTFESLTNIRLGKVMTMILGDGTWEVPSETYDAYLYKFVCSYDQDLPGRAGRILIPTMRDYYDEYAP